VGRTRPNTPQKPCCGHQLRLRYVELLGEIDLKGGADLAKERRHVARHGLGRGLIKQAMGKPRRVQLQAVWRIHGG
jgi:hypothetical protein